MLCLKCKKTILSASAFCMYCGAEIAPKKKKPASHRPHNSGTIRKLSNKRSKPYAAYLPHSMGEKFIGSFKTKLEASNALAVAIADRPSSNRSDWTVKEFYNSLINSKAYSELSKSSKETIQAAWKYCDKISNIKMRSVKTQEWQECIDDAINSGKSKSTCQKIRYLASLICKEAMKDDVINKNYSSLLAVGGTDKKDKDIFTRTELEILKKHDNDIRVKFILILTYTGMRISELLEMKADNVLNTYMIGGNKTAAGKSRIIPILPEISEYVNYFKSNSANNLFIHRDGKKVSANYARNWWFYPCLSEIGILTNEEISIGGKPRLTPHCTRHTFASMARQAGIKEDVLIRIMGHSDYAITDSVYVTMQPEFIEKEALKISNRY